MQAKSSCTFDETRIQVEIVVDDRIKLIRRHIQQILQYKTANLGRPSGAKVSVKIERDKVAQALVTTQYTGIRQEHLARLLEGARQGEGYTTTEPIFGKCLIEEEGSDVVVVGLASGAVCETLIDKDTLSMADSEPDDACEEVRVRLDRIVVAESVVGGICLKIELATLFLGLGDVLLPALEKEVGIVAEVDVFAGDAAIDLEDAVLGQAKSRANRVWDTGVCAANGVFTAHQVTASYEAKGREKDTEAEVKAITGLYGIGSFGKAGDSGPRYVAMVCQGIERWADAPNIGGPWGLELMIWVITGDFLETLRLRRG